MQKKLNCPTDSLSEIGSVPEMKRSRSLSLYRLGIEPLKGCLAIKRHGGRYYGGEGGLVLPLASLASLQTFLFCFRNN